VIPVSPGFHTIIEFVHRQMTVGSTLIVVALLVWTFRATAKGHAARWFAIASAVLLLNEALLGALLVKLGYVTGNQSVGRMVLLSIHLSNTLLLVAALTLTARFLATGHRWVGLHRATGFGWAVAGLAATIAVGVSGSMAALGDTLFPATSLRAAYAQDFAAGSPWLLRLRLVHPVSALVAAVFVIWLVRCSRQAGGAIGRTERIARTPFARVVLGLLLLQFALGVADVLLLAPAWMQLIHLLGADLYWVALLLLAADIVWPTSAVSIAEPSRTHASVA
jgi:cytochrome c oxidase assembly protein subunit 15